MELVKKEDMKKIVPLVGEWEETLIWSCLQGYMGKAWVDQISNPTSVQIITGDFCFFAGEPNKELVNHIPTDYKSDAILMIPKSEEWSEYIEKRYPNQFEKTLRYAIKKELNIFNKEKLLSYIEAIPTEYELKVIDEVLYHKAKEEEWSVDFCSQFSSYQEYAKKGLGVMALVKGEPVAGASSYSIYRNGIEIEIDTKLEYRRQGLALACASKLILECLKRGIYPSWDAHDLRSVALAEKLGYHLEKEYTTYVIEL